MGVAVLAMMCLLIYCFWWVEEYGGLCACGYIGLWLVLSSPQNGHWLQKIPANELWIEIILPVQAHRNTKRKAELALLLLG